LCLEILAKSDYYDVLNLSHEATETDFKKAYKKFAIKLHPDKNHAPESGEAFKKVSAAYACLSDPERKKVYDKYGEDLGQNYEYYDEGYEEDFDANQVYNDFFEGLNMQANR
jgi:DnaJ homolog subfamily B member 12|tara:strand:+ start:322 stop:657 length:336 start_codon:yes stop_codon:yes gene_type:complete